MSNLPALDTQIKVASEAAQHFIESYYSALNKRQPLAQYYASISNHLKTAVTPDISINGKVVKSVAEYEKMLDEQGKPVVYDVTSYDAHPLNPSYVLGCPDALKLPADETAPGRGPIAKSIKSGDRVSFMILVSGVVKYGKPDGSTPVVGAKEKDRAEKKEGTDNEKKTDEPDAAKEQLQKTFSESFLMVPHWESLVRNAPRGLRPYLIVNQNFRTL